MPDETFAGLSDMSRSLIRELDTQHADVQPLGIDTSADSDAAAQACALVKHLRQRSTPKLGYTAAHIERARRHATDESIAKGREKLDSLLAVDQLKTGRGQGLAGASAPMLWAAAKPEHFIRHAELLHKFKPGSDPMCWGTTHTICHLLQHVWPLDTCPDEAVVAILDWLLYQVPPEWAWARTWGDDILGNSGHNWWLHTFGGFWKAGIFFPEFKPLTRFATLVPQWLEDEIRLLLQPDGFTREKSGYHWGTVRMFEDQAWIAELNGIALSDAYHERLRAAADVAWKLAAPSGEIPHFGDGFRTYPHAKLLDTVRKDAARYGIGEAKFVVEQLDPAWSGDVFRTLEGFGEDLLPAYDNVVAQPPDTIDTALEHSGYYVIREDWSPTADWACIDAGVLGPTITSHDHNDIFGFTLYAKGRPIILDNGAGAYGNTPERMWRVASASHNVATVDGLDHVPMRGEWRFEAHEIPTVRRWMSDERFAYFSGAHEAYKREPTRVPGVRRKLFYLRGGYWVLVDRFAAEDPNAAHTYRQHFHLDTSATIDDAGRVTTSGDGGNLAIVPVPGITGAASLEPNPFPLDDYGNPHHLCYTLDTSGSAIMVVVLVPFENDNTPEIEVSAVDVECDNRVLDPMEATGLSITDQR